MAEASAPADQFLIEAPAMAELVAAAMARGASGVGLLVGRVDERTTRTVTDAEHATVEVRRRAVVEALTAAPWAGAPSAREPWRRPLFDAVGRPDLSAWRASIEQSGVAGEGRVILGAWAVDRGVPTALRLREAMAHKHMAVLGSLCTSADGGRVRLAPALQTCWASHATGQDLASVALPEPEGDPGLPAAAALAALPLPLAWGAGAAAAMPGPLWLRAGGDCLPLLESSIPAVADDNSGGSATQGGWYGAWVCEFGAAALRKELAALQRRAPDLLVAAAPETAATTATTAAETMATTETAAAAAGTVATTETTTATAETMATAAAVSGQDDDAGAADASPVAAGPAAGPAAAGDTDERADAADAMQAGAAPKPVTSGLDPEAAAASEAEPVAPAAAQETSPGGSAGTDPAVASDAAGASTPERPAALRSRPRGMSGRLGAEHRRNTESAWATILQDELRSVAVEVAVVAGQAGAAAPRPGFQPLLLDGPGGEAAAMASSRAVEAALSTLREAEAAIFGELESVASAERAGAPLSIV